MGIRIWHGQKKIDLLVCFNCNDLAVISYDANGKENLWRLCDFGENAAPFRAWFRQHLPPDDYVRLMTP